MFENRAARRGRTIKLSVAAIEATDSHPAPDPIFYLAGGPSVAATDEVSSARKLLGPAGARRDLVFVDQCGTVGSNKLACSQPPDPDRQMEELRACLARLDSDPRAYITTWAMDDLDDCSRAGSPSCE